MKRKQRSVGQLLLSFELKVTDDEVVSPPAEGPVEAATPAPAVTTQPKPAKQRKRQTYECSGPSVTLHKCGRKLLIKPNDPEAALMWADLKARLRIDAMRDVSFYDPTQSGLIPAKASGLTPLWTIIDVEPGELAVVRAIKAYGVTVFVDPTLKNWMAKERRRLELEMTAFPVPPVETSVALFDRCCEGTVLRCIKDYTPPGGSKPVFTAGNRYMVVSTGDENKDGIWIGTDAIQDGLVVNVVGKGKTHEWTSFDADMAGWFDDSEETKTGPTIREKYPELVAMMEKKLEKTGLKDKLYEHVQQDVVLMALKRGGLNAYPMRMAKTSFAIAWAKLSGSKQVAFIGPRNARIFTERELKRMGFSDQPISIADMKEGLEATGHKEGVDYVVVDRLADLEKPAWMYLMTYTWLRRAEDATKKERNRWLNYLRPSKRPVRDKDLGCTVDEELKNECPFCKKPLERLVDVPDDKESLPDDAIAFKDEDGKDYFKTWTTARGYICRNKKCTWLTDHRAMGGVSWEAKKILSHKGGYLDWGLAAHAHCEDKQPGGRQCPTCKETDGTWVPGVYKRFTKRFTAVIPDEIHSCKDRTTATARATFCLRSRRRLGLTGTLISNSPMDAFWPLKYTTGGPNKAFPFEYEGGTKQFDERFCESMSLEKPIGEEIDPKTGKKTKLTKLVRKRVPFLKNPPDFWRFMVYQVVRRTYEDPLFLKSLGDANRAIPIPDIKVYPCPMDPEQAKIMLASIKDFKGQFEKMAAEAKAKGYSINSALVISQMSTLKVVATCPERLNRTIGPGAYKGKAGGGKMPWIKQVVKERVEAGGKVVILSDYLDMQETCFKELKEYAPILFNVAWDDEARREAFETFADNPECKVFIGGTRALREGIDLSAADTCICCDLLWSTAFQTQAWSRILTPGPIGRKCTIYIMVSENSIDQHIYGVFYSKLVAAQQAMDRKVMSKRAQEFDVKWFVDRVVEEETAIASYLRQADDDFMPKQDLDMEELEAREA